MRFEHAPPGTGSADGQSRNCALEGFDVPVVRGRSETKRGVVFQQRPHAARQVGAVVYYHLRVGERSLMGSAWQTYPRELAAEARVGAAEPIGAWGASVSAELPRDPSEPDQQCCGECPAGIAQVR